MCTACDDCEAIKEDKTRAALKYEQEHTIDSHVHFFSIQGTLSVVLCSSDDKHHRMYNPILDWGGCRGTWPCGHTTHMPRAEYENEVYDNVHMANHAGPTCGYDV